MFVKPGNAAVALLLTFGVAAVGAEAPPAPRLDAQGDSLPEEAVARLGTTRLRDGGWVNNLLFSPDGKTLISAGTDGVRTWDAATGRRLCHYHASEFALSPDGKRLALPFDGAIHLLELDGGKELRSFGGEGARYSILQFSQDGKQLAALCGVAAELQPNEFRALVQVHLEIWDPATGRKVKSRAVGEPCYFWRSWLGWPDGKNPIVVNYGDNKFRLWDADAGAFRQEFPVGELTVEGGLVAFSPDGARLAAVSDDRRTRRVRVWDAATGKETRQFGEYRLPTDSSPEYLSKYLKVLAFTPDGKTLVTGSPDGTAIFWDPATGEEVRRCAVGVSSPQALAVSPDGKTLAAAHGHTIRLIDPATGKDRLPAAGLQESVMFTAVTADGRTAVTASENRVVLWDAATGKELRRLEGLPHYVAGVAVAADGRSVVSLGYDSTWQVHTLQTWDLPGGKELHRVEWRPKESSPSRLLALAPDGKTAAVGMSSYSRRMVLLDLETGKEQRNFDREAQESPIYGAAFSPDGRTIVVLSAVVRFVRLMDLSTGRLLRQLSPAGAGRIAAVSPDFREIIIGSQESFLALYDVDAGREVARTEKLDDNPGNGRLMAFSPDGRMFAWKGGEPGTIYLTETATLRERHRFTAPQGEVTTLTFTADGKTLITGNSDTTALVWDLTGRLREKEAWGKTLAAAELDAGWSDLAGADAAKAYRAMRRLVGSPQDAVAYLKERLHPVPAVEEKRIARLIADLDGDDFDVREGAEKELGKMEEVALSFCQKALEETASPEARRRLEGLVKRQADRRRHPSAQRLQTLRALETLELTGTPEARRLLEALARGAPEADVTNEANASLERLAKRAE